MKKDDPDRMFLEFYERLTGERAKITVSIVTSLYVILLAGATLALRDSLRATIAAIPMGYLVLLITFLLYTVIVGCRHSFLTAAGVTFGFLKIELMYTVFPMFLWLIMGIAYGFCPEFLVNIPKLIRLYLCVNFVTLVFIPVWISWLYGSHMKEHVQLRRSLKDTMARYKNNNTRG